MSVRTLKVTRIAQTELSNDDALTPAVVQWMAIDTDDPDADVLAEFAGRACYQSWKKPNPNTRANRDYIKHILDVEHYSVLAHATVVYYIEGVSRSLTHELIRHRFMTFSQLSQRYVRVQDELDYVIPPLVRGNAEAEGLLEGVADYLLTAYHSLVGALSEAHPDARPKEIREAARAVLPGMSETKIVCGGNLRAWRDFLAQRLPDGADAEIRELARAILDDLKQIAPHTFQDFTS
jgi:thymidylate synthase (FAD)